MLTKTWQLTIYATKKGKSGYQVERNVMSLLEINLFLSAQIKHVISGVLFPDI